MTINRIGAGTTPVNTQDAPAVQQGGPASLPQGADLPSRTSDAPTASRRGISPQAVQQVQASLNEVNRLLDGKGVAALEQAAREGFSALPAEYRGLAAQTARLAGITGDTAQPVPSLSSGALLQRLDAALSSASELIAATRLDLAGALAQDPQARAEALKPHVEQLQASSRVMAAAVAKMPVAELRTEREAVKEKLGAWTNQTEALHERLKAQLGDTHPVTVAALEARTDAASTFSKTMVRMAVANLGRMAFDLTVGAAASHVRRFFGA
jgi:hypothetical protein